MINKKMKKIFISAMAIIFLIVPFALVAGTPPDFDPYVEGESDVSINALRLARADVFSTTAAIINYAFTFLGLISLLLILYAGYIWMMARGNEEEVKKAQEILKGATIGLIIVMSSYAVSYFVFTNIANIVTSFSLS